MNKESESDTVKYAEEKVTDEEKMIWIEEDVLYSKMCHDIKINNNNYIFMTRALSFAKSQNRMKSQNWMKSKNWMKRQNRMRNQFWFLIHFNNLCIWKWNTWRQIKKAVLIFNIKKRKTNENLNCLSHITKLIFYQKIIYIL